MEERLAVIVTSQRQLEEKLEGILHSRTDPDVYRGSLNRTDKAVAVIQEDGSLDNLITGWIKEGKLDRLARIWVSGVDIEWHSLYGLPKPQRVSLPTYPFARERYWVPVPAKLSDKEVSHEGGPTTPDEGLDRLILTKDWKVTALRDSGTERPGIVVFLGTEQTTTLARTLFAGKAAIQVIEVLQEGTSATSSAISTDFYSATAGDSLYRSLQGAISSRRLLGVVDCTALDSNYGQQPKHEAGKVRFIQCLIEHEAKHGFRLLQLVSRLNPFRTPASTLQGARLAGLYRMINAEYRKVSSVVMDVDLGLSDYPELAARIQSEFLNHDDGAGECCYRQGIRYEPHLVATHCSEDLPDEAVTRVTSNDVFVITGGTRGIGAAVANHLMSRGARRLVLLGRERLPEPAEWKAVVKANTQPDLTRKLEFLLSMLYRGVQLRYFNTALTDSSGLQEMVRQVHSELGSITGIFHCAGSSGENPAFIKKSTHEIETVCEPKVQGLIELHRVLRNEPLRFFVLFSSVSSAIPSLAAGLSDYTMANAFMDFYAMHQASQGQTFFKSIQWPAWGETGMAVGKLETATYARTGLTPLTTADGMRFLELALSSNWTVALPAVMKPVDFDYAQLLSTKFGDMVPRNHAGKEHGRVSGAAPQGIASEASRASIVKWLREILISELKLSADHFRETRRFDEYGVDSVMIAQLVQTMQKRVRGTLAPSLLLEYGSVGALADYFASAHPDDFADSPATAFGQNPAIPAADLRSLDKSDKPAEFRNPDNRVLEPSRDRSVRAGGDGSAIDIAVVGISCRFPGASSKAAYWSALASGHSTLGRMKQPRWQSKDSRFLHGGWLEDIDCFDPGYFNLSESDAAIMDPQARLLLEQGLFALCDAGYDLQKTPGAKVGVYIGGRSQPTIDMNAVLNAPNPILGVNQNYLATNISRFFNFSGPSVVVDTGCSSAITSMLFASDALRGKRIDMAMVGAVSLLLTPDAHRLFAGRNILSESGEFRIFDRRATGEVLGEGAGVLLLRRLQDAIADGNQIYGIIKAISVNNDGRTLGPGSPNIHAQRQVMIDALQSAGLSPEDVGYIEVNGGGSPVVDAVEIKALSEVYRLDDWNLHPCFLGSVKPNVGHLLLASGLAGFLRCVLSVYHRRIPPFLSALEPFEYYDFSASRIRFNREAVDWQVVPGGRRIAAQNSYPDGGTNGHVLIEEFIPDHSYHQQLFSMPEPRLKRSRFSNSPVLALPPSAASVTPVRTEEAAVCIGMRNFLAEFEETGSRGPSGKSEQGANGNGSIRTAWGEYDEKSI
jgi:3-oxoacyl-(acyl-carrier-protein) synthase/NAD(P)-dependent dehydrogenase (short-subunit alcohol dehydrogenase family)/acyl carrier protein